jgi:hypothetical protein
VKAVVIGPDGKEKIDPVHTLNHEFAKTTKEPNLAEALAHFAGTGFVELWKCFEVIRQHAPMLLKTRATRNEISRFTEACQPERHARFRGRRSGIAATYKTMSIEEAREFLRNMLLAWMQ